MKISQKDIMDAISLDWGVASDIDSTNSWFNMMAKLSIIQDLARTANVSRQFRDDLRFLWSVALERS